MKNRIALNNTRLIITTLILSLQTFSTLSLMQSNNYAPPTIKLNYRQNNIDNIKELLPTTLFLHGLDSSSHTWRNILDSLQSKAVAIDLRGCGYSPLGNPNDFTPDAIVNDIYSFLCSHSYFVTNESQHGILNSFVIVGHSMGGRIAMSFAARYPELIKAIVIEDMDVRTRPMSINPFQSNDRHATISFNRNLGKLSQEGVINCFKEEGYPDTSVQKWIKESRVELKEDGCYYSQVNPAFRLLCYEQFFITSHGEDTWRDLVNESNHNIPIHVMVANDENTVCDEKSLEFMKDTIEEKGKLLTLHRYNNATHSIHNSAMKDFLNDLTMIIKTASL